METVVVTNNSGLTLLTHGVRVAPLRETDKDQVFDFKMPQEASSFADYINNHSHAGLTAIYAGNADESGNADETPIEGDERTALIESLKGMSDTDLKKKCKEMNLKGYTRLKGDELVNLIVENIHADSAQPEQE